MSNKTEFLTIRLDEETKEKIRRLAAANFRTMGQQVNLFIMNGLQAQGETKRKGLHVVRDEE